VQCKYDKDGRWGFSAVTITGDRIETSYFEKTDRVIPDIRHGGMSK
jgi:hypothetical protein